MNFRNVLVVAAHPDDEVLGVGGTIPLIKQRGGRVTVVIVTDGSSAQYEDDAQALERKQAQARAASEPAPRKWQAQRCSFPATSSIVSPADAVNT